MKVKNLFRLSGSAALGLMLLAANSDAAIVQRELNFNQVYQGRNYISLRELVFSGGRFPQQGGRLLSLEISAMARGRFASGMLMINGQVNPYGRFQMGRGQNNYRFDVNRFIGQDIQDIGLELDGMVYLQQVRAVIDEPMGGGFPGQPGYPGYPGQPGGGGVERFQQPITQWYYSGQTFRLRQLLNLGPQFDGRVVEYVEFAGRTQQGTAQATVMINGVAAGQSVILDGYDRLFRIPVNRVMGHDIQTLQIQFVGATVYIDFMAVAMRAGMQQPQPYPQPYPGQPGAGPAPAPGTGPGSGAGPGVGGPGRPGPRLNSSEKNSESAESEE